jgi:integrase
MATETILLSQPFGNRSSVLCTLARQKAVKAIKRQLQAQGLKPHHMAHREIIAAAEDYLRDHPELSEQAAETVHKSPQLQEEGSPKTAAGVRTVPLSAQLVSALKAWKLQSQFSQPEDLIFTSRVGGYLGHDNLIKRQFAPLQPSFNWHGLRHFAVSTWIEAGMSPKTVQTFAGHASLQVTMDRYGHLFPSEDHNRAMDRIAQQLFARTPSEH